MSHQRPNDGNQHQSNRNQFSHCDRNNRPNNRNWVRNNQKNNNNNNINNINNNQYNNNQYNKNYNNNNNNTNDNNNQYIQKEDLPSKTIFGEDFVSTPSKDIRNLGWQRHLYEQVTQNFDSQKQQKYHSHLKEKLERQLNQDFCQPYTRRQNEKKSVIHWGQRKLLMSEIEFLSQYTPQNKDGEMIVVYAGAAPGTHIPFLCELFPGFIFHLYDPAPFTCEESEYVKLNPHSKSGMFLDETAEFYRAKKIEKNWQVMFISDIRTADPSELTEDETENQVAVDMEMQKSWVVTMCPTASMLKFRLSWKPGHTPYLEGSIFLPVWGPITTTETRLVVTGEQAEKAKKSLFQYDNKQYEQAMFYFNTTTRIARYPHNIDAKLFSSTGLDYCYDCSAEISILKGYLETRFADSFKVCLTKKITNTRDQFSRLGNNITSNDQPPVDQETSEIGINDLIGQMVLEIAPVCSKTGRTLRDPNPDPARRKELMNKNQRVQGVAAYKIPVPKDNLVNAKKIKTEETDANPSKQ